MLWQNYQKVDCVVDEEIKRRKLNPGDSVGSVTWPALDVAVHAPWGKGQVFTAGVEDRFKIG